MTKLIPSGIVYIQSDWERIRTLLSQSEKSNLHLEAIKMKIKPYKNVDFYYGGYNVPVALNERGQVLLGVSFIFDLIRKNGYLSDYVQRLADNLCLEIQTPFLTEKRYKKLIIESCTPNMAESLLRWIDKDIIPISIKNLDAVPENHSLSSNHRLWSTVNWKNKLLNKVSRRFCW